MRVCELTSGSPQRSNRQSAFICRQPKSAEDQLNTNEACLLCKLGADLTATLAQTTVPQRSASLHATMARAGHRSRDITLISDVRTMALDMLKICWPMAPTWSSAGVSMSLLQTQGARFQQQERVLIQLVGVHHMHHAKSAQLGSWQHVFDTLQLAVTSAGCMYCMTAGRCGGTCSVP